jgi:hypothetical protein
MLKNACKKHASWIGCVVAVVTFVVLHVAVPALVATGVAGHAHADSDEVGPNVLFKVDDVTVYRIEVPNVSSSRAPAVCLITVADVPFETVKVDVECVK